MEPDHELELTVAQIRALLDCAFETPDELSSKCYDELTTALDLAQGDVFTEAKTTSTLLITVKS